jgi:hypothetical protein
MPEVGVDQPQLLTVEVQLPQQRRCRDQLVGRELLGREPGSAFVAEQVRRRTARDQVAVQDRVHLVLQPVRWRTMCARRSTCRRSALVAGSWRHTAGR